MREVHKDTTDISNWEMAIKITKQKRDEVSKKEFVTYGNPEIIDFTNRIKREIDQWFKYRIKFSQYVIKSIKYKRPEDDEMMAYYRDQYSHNAHRVSHLYRATYLLISRLEGERSL